VNVDGNSGSLDTKIDLDVPLDRELFGHELHAGGYISRTDLFGELRTGLDTQHVNEIHGRLVLDYLNQVWKFKWIGRKTAAVDTTFVELALSARTGHPARPPKISG
jgi:hypothetical protein